VRLIVLLAPTTNLNFVVLKNFDEAILRPSSTASGATAPINYASLMVTTVRMYADSLMVCVCMTFPYPVYSTFLRSQEGGFEPHQ
jgi:hypothetical protein